MKQLLTAEQASALLQVTKNTLANWEKAGKIQTHRQGRIVRYYVDVEVPATKRSRKNGNTN
jgi:predicted site-specific integrase-resolvase